MTERWKCTSYCLCGSRRGHFEKSSDGVWVLYESHAARIRELECPLNDILPGLILDLRHTDPDDDKDAMQSRIKTVTDALGFTVDREEDGRR